MVSLKRVLRVGGVVGIAALLVAVGAFVNARATQAGTGAGIPNQVIRSAGPGHAAQAKGGALHQVNFALLPTAPSTFGADQSHAIRLPLSDAAYAKLKVAAAHNPNAPHATNIMAPPLSRGSDPTAKTPGPAVSFGQQQNGFTPSDMGLAVGDGVAVQVVNETIATYAINQGTHLLSFSCGFHTLQSFFGSTLSDSVGDPRAFYDPQTDRFFVLGDDFTNDTYYIAISNSTNPCGTWTTENVNIGSLAPGELTDFPGFGFDSEAIYFSTDFFGNSGFDRAAVLACPKSAALCSGGAFGFQGMSDGTTNVFDVQPAESYGTPRAEILINSNYETTNTYTVWAFSNPIFAGAGGQSLTGVVVGNSAFTAPPTGQDPSGDSIDTGFVNVTGQPIWRDGSLYFSITSGINNGSGVVPGILWFIFGVGLNNGVPASPRNDTIKNAYGRENWQILYGGTQGAYYPSQSVDAEGDFCFTYIYSSSTAYPTTAVECRRPTTPRGSNPNSFTLVTASGPFTQGRMGDYTATAFDPSSAPTNSPACFIGTSMFTVTSGASGFWKTSFGDTCWTINSNNG